MGEGEENEEEEVEIMKAYRKQHYLPECYLKNFSFDGKGIFVYRKNLKENVFRQSISNIACEKNFYDIPEKYLLPEYSDKVQYIEKDVFAGGFEKLFSELLPKIITNCSSWTAKLPIKIINSKERDYFAELIALQYLRLPQFRKRYWEANKDLQKKRADIITSFLAAQNPQFKDEKVSLEFDEKAASAYHSDFILDESWRYKIQDQIVKKNWIYYYTDKNVYTSDNPILLKPHLPNSKRFIEGFAMKGVEIIFPISSKIILTIWDEEYFPESSRFNNSVVMLEDKKLREYNYYQYCFSRAEVYSSTKDFKIIDEYKSVNGNHDYNGISGGIQIF